MNSEQGYNEVETRVVETSHDAARYNKNERAQDMNLHHKEATADKQRPDVVVFS